MKLTKLAIGAVSTLCFFSCQNEQEPQNDKNVVSTASIPTDNNFISIDSANKMIQSYLTSIKDSTNPDQSLQSLILDAKTLRAYLSDTSITDIKVIFSHKLDYINSGHNGQPAGYSPTALTIVLAGYNASGNYVFAQGNMVPDNARPCPTNCPTIGTASSPLLQQAH